MSPPLLEQAANVAGAVVRVISAVVHGEPVKANPAVHDARLAICGDCEFNVGRRLGVNVKCTRCGCGGVKLHLATERCPVGKWERIDEPES